MEKVVVITEAEYNELVKLLEAVKLVGSTGDALIVVKSQYERYKQFYDRFHEYCKSIELELFGEE